MSVAIVEAYTNFEPPTWIRPTVARLVAGIQNTYLNGIDAIILTNRDSVGPGKVRVGGRKHTRRHARGFYKAQSARPASIELVVDNIVKGAPWYATSCNFSRDILVSDVLFHEIGHHLSFTIGANKRAPEPAAEDWKNRLRRAYFNEKYGWMRSLAPVLLPFVRWWRRRLKTSSKDHVD